jgi:hypothetical protein
MTNAYFLTWKANNKVASCDINVPAHLIEPEIIHLDKLPYKFYLKDNNPEDYLGNIKAWPLMSEKMKAVIIENLSGKEDISWIEVDVQTPTEILSYYILKYNTALAVIDLDKTIFISYPDNILKPVFDVAAIKNINIFVKPDRVFPTITCGIFVNDAMKNALRKSKLTGFKFEQLATNSDSEG